MCCRCSAAWGKSGPEWQTGLWMLRGQHLFLVPGDSPVGLRLPLGSLPWVAAADDAETVHEVDPMVKRGPLPVPPRMSPEDPILQREHDRSATGSPRRRVGVRGSCGPPFASNRATAACTSSCRRRRRIEDYLDLLAAIEDTAAHLRCRW